MVDHFHAQVLAAGKIGGQARAMVITSGIERAIQYFHAFQAYLRERKSPYQAIVAFSCEHEYGGVKVSEASLNGFASGDIARKIQTDPYRFLICADKFQTGYDEPLLHTMYRTSRARRLRPEVRSIRDARPRPGSAFAVLSPSHPASASVGACLCPVGQPTPPGKSRPVGEACV